MEKVDGLGILTLKLEQLGYRSYKEYLESPHWQQFRARFYATSKRVKAMRAKYGRPVCQACSSPRFLNLHHVTYIRLGGEYLADVRLLCRNCHTNVHASSFKLRRGTRRTIRGDRRQAASAAERLALQGLGFYN